MDDRGHLITDAERQRIEDFFGQAEAQRYEPLPEDLAGAALKRLAGMQETRIDGKGGGSLDRFLAKIKARKDLKAKAALKAAQNNA